MRRRVLAAVVVATMIVALNPATVGAGSGGDARLDGAASHGAPAGPPTKTIVTFREPPGRAADALVAAAGGTVRFRYTIIPAMAVTVPAAALDGLRRSPLVKAVEIDGRVTILDHGTSTGDLEYDNAWGVHHLGTKRVHDSGDWGQGVTVAVIDSGIDYVHYDLSGPQPVYPEFNGNYRGGWDFVNNDADPLDDNGHGTHVSGILAADKNGYLVVGMAPRVELYALKVVDASGNGEYSSVIAALQWAVVHSIDVVNMSIGGHDPSQALADAVEATYQAGILMVAAAGNVDPFNIWELIYGCPVVVPAAYPHVLATTFTDGTDQLTGYSCTGPEVDFGSPGDEIYSAVPVGSCMLCSPYGYMPLSGTSMASPHLAGLVALVLSHGIADANGDGLLFDEVRAHLCANTDPGGRIAQTDPRYPSWYGCGVIDADKALVDNPPPTGAANGAPVAGADAATTTEDSAVTIAVLANDSDPDGDPLTVSGVTQPAHGSAAIDAASTVTYAPAANWNGADSFTYTVSDGHGGSATATVSVTVSAVNDPPVAANDTASTVVGVPVTIAVLANDMDVDGDALTVDSVTQPAYGSAAIDPTGTVTYTPAAGYSGPDGFTYVAADGHGGAATASVSITVSTTAATVMHIGDLVPGASRTSRNWTAQVGVLVVDQFGAAVSGATVSGKWTGGAKGTGSCITLANGTCTIAKSGIAPSKASVTFTVTSVTKTGATYDASANVKTSITILRP